MRLVFITFLSLVTIGCRESVTPTNSELSKPATVALTLNATLKGRLLTIDGKTDLPDGVFIVYEVTHEGAATRVDFPIEKMFAQGESLVAGGNYESTINLAGWPAGQLEVWVAFQTVVSTTKHQPPEIISRFGELGERLEGPNVTQKKGKFRRVEITKPLTLKASGAKKD